MEWKTDQCGCDSKGNSTGRRLLSHSFTAVATAAMAFLSAVPVVSAEDDAGKALPVRVLPQQNLMLYHNDSGDVVPVKSKKDWEQRRQEVLANMQAVMGPLPGDEKRCPLDLQVIEEVDAGKFVRRKITYQSEPGGRVPGYLLVPKSVIENPSVKVPAVLCLHPTHNQGPNEMVGMGAKRNRQYGEELAERGYVVLAPNYPHLGIYAPDLKTLGWKSGSMKAIWDNKRGLDLLDSLPYVQSGSYAAIGHSLGGHNSVYTAVFDDRIKAVVSCCGLDSYVHYMSGNPAVWEPGKGWTQERYIPRLAQYKGRLNEIPYDFHELVGALAPRRVLIVAPLRDSNFKHDSVDEVVVAARPVFQLYGVPQNLEVVHPDVEHDFPVEMREKSYELIDTVLKHTK